MCRWIAYAGPEIYLEDLLFEQEHSIVRQSLAARESAWVTNGDGFGVAWYGTRAEPGLFKDILPAWNDSNLRSLATQIRTSLFFAHVRASTGTAVSRTNCHPFTWRNWAFMHNGGIGGWETCRRDVESRIAPEFYPLREGTTDSEALFLLALGHGLPDDPPGAVGRALAEVQGIMREQRVSAPLRASIALTDGQEVWAFRYSSDERSPSLYYGAPSTRSDRCGRHPIHTIASEPSDSDASHWFKVHERSFVHWTHEAIVVRPFQPDLPDGLRGSASHPDPVARHEAEPVG